MSAADLLDYDDAIAVALVLLETLTAPTLDELPLSQLCGAILLADDIISRLIPVLATDHTAAPLLAKLGELRVIAKRIRERTAAARVH